MCRASFSILLVTESQVGGRMDKQTMGGVIELRGMRVWFALISTEHKGTQLAMRMQMDVGLQIYSMRGTRSLLLFLSTVPFALPPFNLTCDEIEEAVPISLLVFNNSSVLGVICFREKKTVLQIPTHKAPFFCFSIDQTRVLLAPIFLYAMYAY